MHPYDLAEAATQRPSILRLAERVDRAVPGRLRAGPLADRLRGDWLGHPLHPVLSDLPLGMFAASTTLDLVGRGRWSRGSALLTGIGLAAAVPTAVSGLAEWHEVPAEDRPTATAHAALNIAATSTYAAGMVARLRGRHGPAAGLSVAGGLLALLGGYLGGHLSFGRRIGGPRRSATGRSPR